MSYAQVDGKGSVHITATSMSRDSYSNTLCGKSGQLVLVPDETVEKVCARCTAIEQGQA